MKKALQRFVLPLLAAGALTPAFAGQVEYVVNLDGPSEPNGTSPGVGTGSVIYDDTARTLSLAVTFSGLIGNVTVSHIHAATAVAGTGTAGVATPTPTFPGFPAGVTSGSYSSVLDLSQASSFNAAFLNANGGTTASAEAALASAMAAGKAYWNIHSTFAAGGEIRGFLTPVPEPSTLALAGLAATGLILRARNRRR